jgi:hypothetical protein
MFIIVSFDFLLLSDLHDFLLHPSGCDKLVNDRASLDIIGLLFCEDKTDGDIKLSAIWQA